jgi:hypothetical protein
MTLKIADVAPMPSVRDRRATAMNAGLRLNERIA